MKTKFALTLISTAILTACGGGGGGDGGSSTPAPSLASCNVGLTGQLLAEYGAAATPSMFTVLTNETCADVQSKLTALLAPVRDLIQRLGGDRDKALANATMANAMLAQAQADALKSKEELTAQITSLQAQLRAAPTPAQVAELNAEITSLRAQLAAAPRQADIDAYIAKVEAYVAEVNAIFAAGAAEIDRLQALNGQLNSLNIELASKLNSTTGELVAARLRAEQAEAALAAAPSQAQLDDIKAQLVTAQAALLAAPTQAQVDALVGQIASLTAQLSASQGDTAALAVQIAALQTQLATTATARDKAEADVKAISDQLTSAQAALTAAPTTAQIDALNAQVAALQATLSASGDAVAILDAAKILAAQAAADKADADAAKAQAAIDVAAAQGLALQAAIDRAEANSALAAAQAAQAAASTDAEKATADRAAAVALTEQAVADVATANAAKAAAEASAAAAIADRDVAVAARIVAETALATALSDLTAANLVITTLQTQLANAPTQSAVDGLNATIATLTAQLASTSALNAAEVAALNAAIVTLTAERDAALGTNLSLAAQVASLQNELAASQATAAAQIVTLNVTIAGLQAQAIIDLQALTGAQGQVTALTAALAAAPTQAAVNLLNATITQLQTTVNGLNGEIGIVTASRNALLTQVASLQATIVSLQAQIAAGGTSPLPFCVASPNPIVATSTFTGVGSTCVVSYVDQVALAAAITAAANSVKFEGVYSNAEAFVVAEVGGKVWSFEQITPAGLMHTITQSNGSSFSATGTSTIGTQSFFEPVALTGTYTKGDKATLTYGYDSPIVIADLLYSTEVTTVPLGNMGGQDFLTGSHDVRLTTASDGSFTGAEGQCKFTGNFTSTPYGYKKVSITWGANCAVPTNAVGEGVMVKYGPNYQMITSQPGAFTNVAFICSFHPSLSTGTAAPAAMPISAQAKALQAAIKARAR